MCQLSFASMYYAYRMCLGHLFMVRYVSYFIYLNCHLTVGCIFGTVQMNKRNFGFGMVGAGFVTLLDVQKETKLMTYKDPRCH